MILISASQLTKTHGGLICFRDADLQIHSGQRIGLIGRNGAGKTTLLRILSGEEEYEGNLARRRGLRIARLKQTPVFPPGIAVREAVAESARDVLLLEREIQAHREALAEPDLSSGESGRLLKKLAALERRFDAAGGHDVERRIDAVLHGLGFAPDRFSRPVGSLSGGEQNRVALARLLLLEPDLWLLDEPTNHIDLDGIAFLERFLSQTRASALIISHDRRFLDSMTAQTWEIEGCKLHVYPGNYSQSRAIREERRLAAWRAYEQQQWTIARTKDYIRRYGAGQRAKEARGRAKRLARVERIERPEAQARLMALNLPVVGRLGNRILEARALEMGFGDKSLFRNLSFEWEAGETFGVAGPNGAGKTTLLQMLLGELKPRTGSIRWGETVRLGKLMQHDAFPDESFTPLSYLRSSGLGRGEQDLRDTLAAMLFQGGEVDRPVRLLSGGEKRRLMLTALLLRGHNAILLDEPTNNLDLDSCEALELALSAYEGNLLVISHDRHFLDQIADRILWLEDGAWRITRGGYQEAEQARQEARVDSERIESRKQRPRSKPELPAAKPRSPYVQWRTGRIESRIIAIEERLEQIHALLGDSAVYTNGERMKELHSEMNAIHEEQAALEEEYAKRKM